MTDDDTLSDANPAPIIAFDDLLFACTNLCEIIELENDALAAHDAETVRLLTENKVALAKLYEAAMEPLIKTPELAETLEPEQRDELVEVGLRLNELSKINAQRLEAEMEAYQRVMDILARNARKQKTSTTTYGRAGTFAEAGAASGALTFNKSL